MAAELHFGPIRDSGDRARYVEILAESFVLPREREERWVEQVGAENVRLLYADGELVAGLVIHPDFGQYFGGRRIPCCGIAGVATHPGHRGRGLATALVRGAILEAHRQGIPLSALYPADLPLYRRAGFEAAGGRFEIRAAPSALDQKDRTLPLRPLGASERPALVELHRAALREGNGGIDRNDYLWKRVFHPEGETARLVGVFGTGGMEGYAAVHSRRVGDESELHVLDLVARTPPAATRLLTWLADYHTLHREVIWYGSATDPLLALLRERRIQVRLQHAWMLRIVDVAAALASRGYPADLRGSLHLELFDEVIPANRGRFLLEVEEGVGRVRPGGEGRLRLHVRGLAALYSGWRSADDLAVTGLLEGDPTERRRATAFFAGPQPALRDMF